MTTIINGSSPAVTFSDGTTQSTAGLPLTGGTVTGGVNIATSSGNVGIGTASPNSAGVNKALTISGTSNSIMELNAGSTRCGYMYATTAATILSAVPASSIMQFNTVDTERMRIDASGKLLINTTSAYAPLTVRAANGGNAISTNNDSGTGPYNAVVFLNNGQSSAVGTIYISGSTVTYNTSSDYRLKENIAPMQGALATVSQLKPVTYNWKSDGSDGQGFIAHELQAVVPDCVTGEKDAVDEEGKPVYQGIDTSFLVATLTAAIQELNAKVDALEAKLEAKP